MNTSEVRVTVREGQQLFAEPKRASGVVFQSAVVDRAT